MAYKNRKKNKRYIRELRVKEGGKRRKSEREKSRNHPNENLTIERLEQIMHEQGMI